MNSYENLPRLHKEARVMSYRFEGARRPATYALLYAADQDGQLYVSLEHLTAMLYGSVISEVPQCTPFHSNLINPYLSHIGAPRFVFEWYQDKALQLGAKVIMYHDQPYALGLPLETLGHYLREVQLYLFDFAFSAIDNGTKPRHLAIALPRLNWLYSDHHYQHLAAELTRDYTKYYKPQKHGPATPPCIGRRHYTTCKPPRIPYYTWL